MNPKPARIYKYHRRLPHYQSDKPLFVTFCTQARRILPDAARQVVLTHCHHDRGTKLLLHAAIVMPDHAHLLLSILRDPDGWPYELRSILQSLKSASAHSVNKLLGTSDPVWHPESFDHTLRSYEGLEETREYIRQNPVRKGLVKTPEDYPWLWLEERIL